MEKHTIGLDTAKSIFHAVTTTPRGRVIKKKALKRGELLRYFAQLAPTVVAMEACGASHYLCRELIKLGHDARMIPPQYVVPFRKGNKNDFNDAIAIAAAAQRDDMRFVPLKSVEQQDIQMLHRVRQLHVKNATGQSNQIRGLLSEYGIVLSKGKAKLQSQLPLVLEDAENGLSEIARALFSQLIEELHHQEEKIKALDKQIALVAKQQSACQHLMQITGIGPNIATILYAAIGNGEAFKNSRHVGAWAGFAPRQTGSGGTVKLLGISKRGNTYLRTQLINGARAAMRHLGDKQDAISCWTRSLLERSSFNLTCVALAHKMLRMAWAMLRSGEDYRYAQ